jgi:sugar phosphate isomerase/epimerase
MAAPTPATVFVPVTLPRWPATLAYAREQGFGLQLNDFADPAVAEHSDELAARYSQLVADTAVDVPLLLHGPFVDLYLNSPDTAIRQVARQRLERSLQIADELGAEGIIVHTNVLPMISEPGYREGWLTAHADFWPTAADAHKAVVLLENMWDPTPDLMAQVLERINSARVRACFDVGHWHAFGRRVPIDTWVDRLGDFLRCVHLNDNTGAADDELPVGAGKIPWQDVADALARLPHRQHLVLEVDGLAEVQQSVSYLRARSLLLTH